MAACSAVSVASISIGPGPNLPRWVSERSCENESMPVEAAAMFHGRKQPESFSSSVCYDTHVVLLCWRQHQQPSARCCQASSNER